MRHVALAIALFCALSAPTLARDHGDHNRINHCDRDHWHVSEKPKLANPISIPTPVQVTSPIPTPSPTPMVIPAPVPSSPSVVVATPIVSISFGAHPEPFVALTGDGGRWCRWLRWNDYPFLNCEN